MTMSSHSKGKMDCKTDPIHDHPFQQYHRLSEQRLVDIKLCETIATVFYESLVDKTVFETPAVYVIRLD